jgi:hypothetical protein
MPTIEEPQGTKGMSTTAEPNNNRNANNSMNAENSRDPSQNRDANYSMDSNKSRDDNDGGKTRKQKGCQQLQDYSNSKNTYLVWKRNSKNLKQINEM